MGPGSQREGAAAVAVVLGRRACWAGAEQWPARPSGLAQEGSRKRGKRRRLAGRREKGLAGQIERGEGMRNEEAFSLSK